MLAFDNVLDKHVALKIIRKEELTDYERWRVLRETDLLKTLSHPNIIRLENFIETETDFVIVLEYMNDGDLFDLLQQSGKLLPEQVRIIAVQIALALKYLHSRKVIHRDIKPENVGIRQPLASMANIPADITEAIESSSSTTTTPLTTEEPSGSVDENEAWTKVKLIDFSLSRYAKDGRARTPCGTLGYMAPEMMLVNLHECEYTSAVDMWAFGCLLYALLTGTPPFEIGKMPESKQDVLVQFPESLWRDIPADAQQCVRACLDPDAVYYREPSPPPPGWYLPTRLRTPSPGLYERLSRYDEEIARRREAAAKGEVVVGGDKTVAEAVAEMYAGKSFVVKVVAGAGNYDEKVEVPIYHA
ncbi:kinase-like protein [Rhizoclosmatium globosum]|uniref:Kinase-like protein n=1 Tax=Rhizoclosmatium globosum TaxID=329046 RepID=A0A1Y2C210_9FUNG|nr:kinase-like protein [Rhizoclosmatium globosum]|eukprot:ORY40917.1 kinase-like protein [Rhizoclosmatium globosum]